MSSLSELMSLKGRTALVTGATGGLGRVIVQTLAELGANLLLVDRPGAPIDALVDELRRDWAVASTGFQCDLEQEEQRTDLLKHVKADTRLRVLVNNAAFVGTSNLDGWATRFEQQSVATWRRALEVNLTAVFHLSQGLASALQDGKGGSIVNIASIYGTLGPDWRLYEDTTMGNPAAYAASKGGLLQLTRWLATTLSPTVRVNAISPGGIFRNQPEVFVERYQARTPLGRMARADDFKGAITFLATDLSAYVTGQNIVVDGGWSVW